MAHRRHVFDPQQFCAGGRFILRSPRLLHRAIREHFILAPIAIEPSTVMAFGGNLTPQRPLLALAGNFMAVCGVGIATLRHAILNQHGVHARIRRLFGSTLRNPLHLREGGASFFPDISCKETAPDSSSSPSQPHPQRQKRYRRWGPSISSRLRGRFSRYAVVFAEADVAYATVTFFLEDVTLHRDQGIACRGFAPGERLRIPRSKRHEHRPPHLRFHAHRWKDHGRDRPLAPSPVGWS